MLFTTPWIASANEVAIAIGVRALRLLHDHNKNGAHSKRRQETLLLLFPFDDQRSTVCRAGVLC